MSKRFVEPFLIYFVVFEKKVFNFFFCSKMPKSLIDSLTFKLKKSKIQLFFRFLQIPSKCEEMVPDNFRSVPWTQNTLFPSRNTLTIYQEKKFQNQFWGLEKMIFEISNFHQFEAAGWMKKWTDLHFIPL